MITLDSLKRFDPTTINLSSLDVRNITMPKFEMPKFEMPKFEMPKFEMPVDADRLVGLARDAAYVGVGAVVVVAHEADERVRNVAEAMTVAVSDAVATATDTVTARARRIADAVR